MKTTKIPTKFLVRNGDEVSEITRAEYLNQIVAALKKSKKPIQASEEVRINPDDTPSLSTFALEMLSRAISGDDLPEGCSGKTVDAVFAAIGSFVAEHNEITSETASARDVEKVRKAAEKAAAAAASKKQEEYEAKCAHDFEQMFAARMEDMERGAEEASDKMLEVLGKSLPKSCKIIRIGGSVQMSIAETATSEDKLAAVRSVFQSQAGLGRTTAAMQFAVGDLMNSLVEPGPDGQRAFHTVGAAAQAVTAIAAKSGSRSFRKATLVQYARVAKTVAPPLRSASAPFTLYAQAATATLPDSGRFNGDEESYQLAIPDAKAADAQYREAMFKAIANGDVSTLAELKHQQEKYSSDKGFVGKPPPKRTTPILAEFFRAVIIQSNWDALSVLNDDGERVLRVRTGEGAATRDITDSEISEHVESASAALLPEYFPNWENAVSHEIDVVVKTKKTKTAPASETKHTEPYLLPDPFDFEGGEPSAGQGGESTPVTEEGGD